jgi:hypothetical protein
LARSSLQIFFSLLGKLRNVGLSCKVSSLLALRAPRHSRKSVHHALRKGAAFPFLATLWQLPPAKLQVHQAKRALSSLRWQCSIKPS